MDDPLFLDNVNLVYKIAHKMDYGFVDKDDLIQAGLMGLFNATKKFNDDLNTKFSTFASYYIIGSIKEELRKNKLIRINKEIISLVRKLKDFDYNLSVDSLSNKYNTSKENIILALNYSSEVTSLNVVKNDQELLSKVIDESSINNSENEVLIRFNKLDDTSKRIISLKYFEGYTQEKIAALLKKNQSTVSRIEKNALKKMKEMKL